MSDNKQKKTDIEELTDGTVTLTDEETGKDFEFNIVAKATIDGSHYYALLEKGSKDEEYVLLKVENLLDNDVIFSTIDDDDEYDKVEDYFNDLLFGDADYDN